MKSGLNYLGQLRLYSLIDLILFLIAAGADGQQFMGVIFLWVGFLAYLESAHKHGYRKRVPKWVAWVLYLFGLVLFPKIEALAFVVLGYFYAKKKEGGFAQISPSIRGFQSLMLVGAITGYQSFLPLIAGVVTAIRNFLGDIRDVKKDGEEGMNTIPVNWNIKVNLPYVHLFAVMATSAVAWYFADIPVVYLWAVFVVQGATYDLTPR